MDALDARRFISTAVQLLAYSFRSTAKKVV